MFKENKMELKEAQKVKKPLYFAHVINQKQHDFIVFHNQQDLDDWKVLNREEGDLGGVSLEICGSGDLYYWLKSKEVTTQELEKRKKIHQLKKQEIELQNQLAKVQSELVDLNKPDDKIEQDMLDFNELN